MKSMAICTPEQQGQHIYSHATTRSIIFSAGLEDGARVAFVVQANSRSDPPQGPMFFNIVV